MQSADFLLDKVTTTGKSTGNSLEELQENVDDMRIIVLCAQHVRNISPIVCYSLMDLDVKNYQ